jgi:hypothetical protein
MRTIKDFMARLYNVHDMGESAQRIMQAVTANVPASNALILMGHNGPAGLGAQRHNICGVDWVREAGDHGDPDLASVMQQLREAGRRVALVVFGHMHHKLRGKQCAVMWVFCEVGCGAWMGDSYTRNPPLAGRCWLQGLWFLMHICVVDIRAAMGCCRTGAWQLDVSMPGCTELAAITVHVN